MKKIFLFLFVAIFISGCQESAPKDIHEEVMYENGADVVSQISPTVATIYHFSQEKGDSESKGEQGSGVFIAKDKIVTNHHVIANFKEGDGIIIRQSDGSTFYATGILVSDPAHDLAILQFDSKNQTVVVASIGDSEKVRQGQEVYAIGSPQGLVNTVTKGIISNTSLPKGKLAPEVNAFQHDASMDHGSSGGGLFTVSDGKLIGINYAILAEGKQQANFSIPTKYLEKLLGINSVKTSFSKDKKIITKFKKTYGSKTMVEGADDLMIAGGSGVDLHKMHFLFSSITTMGGRIFLFVALVLLGYLVAYLLFRKAIAKKASPQKSLTVSSVWIIVTFLAAMFFCFTDLIFTQKVSNPYQDSSASSQQETNIVE